MLCIFGCIDLGRFALGMLLPAMAQPLKLSYSKMGVISTSDFIGYLFAMLLCGKTVMRFGAREVISLALFLVGGSMMAVGGIGSGQVVAFVEPRHSGKGIFHLAVIYFFLGLLTLYMQPFSLPRLSKIRG